MRERMTSPKRLQIRELDLDSIYPSTEGIKNIKLGGSKIFVIGKPGTGKSKLIRSLLYEKSHIFPVCMVMSGTEDSNDDYKKIVPDIFIYPKYEKEAHKNFVKRQKIAKKHVKNPWAILLLDDCNDDPAIFRDPLMLGMMKNSRHWCCLFIVALQYSMDIKPVIRTCIDGTFILRETNMRNRKCLHENYVGSAIPDFSEFNEVMDFITDDYTALFIRNNIQSNKFEEMVFYYKARLDIPDDFRIGCAEYWDFHQERFNEDYVDPVFA